VLLDRLGRSRYLDHADWGAANLGVELGADGTLTGSKSFVADASVADCFAVVASEGGEPVLALVERNAMDDSALQKTC
jgi:alkylation response protein AidB-like acyl-CoA dehydrogenase